MLPPRPTPLTRLLTARSVLDHPQVRRHPLDAAQIRDLAGMARCGDLTVRQVATPSVLSDLASTTAADLLAPDDVGWHLGHSLAHALEHGVRLWLCEVDRDAPGRISAVLGEDLIHVVSLDSGLDGGTGLDGRTGLDGGTASAGTVVIAVSPLELVLSLAGRSEASRGYLREVLEGVDTLRCPHRAIAALRAAGVAVMERPATIRLARNPVALAYVVVFIYSSLRALPVAFVPGFRGQWWVLWLIDILTAIPYTWGIVEMVAGRRLRWRLLGLATTLFTFLAPYVYFWIHGRDSPPGVLAIVVLMIVGSAGLEAVRWWRDRVIVRGLEEATPF
mgnify:FL=1